MTPPVPSSSTTSSFLRHDKAVAKQIPADPRDGNDTASRRQQLDIEESLLPLKKRATSSGGATDDDDSFMITQYDSSTMSEQTLQEKKLVHDSTVTHRGDVGCDYSHALAARNRMRMASAVGPTRAKKLTNRNCNKRPRPAAPENVPFVHKTLPRLGPELSECLQKLDATAPPQFVCKKTLHKSDVDEGQNRLLFSCKRDVLARHPITALYAGSDKEAYFVHECKLGLGVKALDGHGREFDIRLRYLESNEGYRLITGWRAFVEANELRAAWTNGLHVEVELWAFRSKKLPDQQAAVMEGLEDHPDGALGLLFLPYVRSAAAEEERPPVPVRSQAKRPASASAEVVRLRQEHKIEQHDNVLRANRGKAVVERQMTFDEVVAAVGPQEAEPLVGLLMLRSSLRSAVPMLHSTHVPI